MLQNKLIVNNLINNSSVDSNMGCIINSPFEGDNPILEFALDILKDILKLDLIIIYFFIHVINNFNL